ncbi:hypothetical protein F66182_9805 [Fusarium sp. NRRL 66182]|nr:hypothetical protein F66182_9805 [Fusarium sp. NRRL 66182]
MISRGHLSQAADAANVLSEFVAYEQIRTITDLRSALFGSSTVARQQNLPPDHKAIGVVVLCASAVLPTAEAVLSMVTELAEITENESIVLVLCGGIGHSIQLMHDAVTQHPEYSAIANHVRGLPEARILKAIAEEFFHLEVESNLLHENLTILVEDTSTNCWLNAKNTREVLDAHGYKSPNSIVVSQDPTMCRRTVAAFEQVYADNMDKAPVLTSWPTFVPKVAPNMLISTSQTDNVSSCLHFDIHAWGDIGKDDLWSMGRFMSLLVGEIPRMRDDEDGYGPRGKGSIAHVDIPQPVEDSWKTLCQLLGQSGR